MEHACTSRGGVSSKSNGTWPQERLHASLTKHRQLDTLGPGASFRRILNIFVALHLAMYAVWVALLGVRRVRGFAARERENRRCARQQRKEYTWLI